MNGLFYGGVRLYEVFVYGFAVELRKDVHPVGRARNHPGKRTLGGNGIRSLHRRAGEKWWTVRWRWDEVRHLVLHAKWTRAAIIDNQRCSQPFAPRLVANGRFA